VLFALGAAVLNYPRASALNFYFLHNHYLPAKVRTGDVRVQSVIVPEFYPDLNWTYLGDACHFNSVEAYINHVVQNGYYSAENVYSIENSRIINPGCIRRVLLRYKELGVKIIQLYCGTDNVFVSCGRGLSREGEHLLSEVLDAELILDLSHLSDDLALSIARVFRGRMIISHCACSDLYTSKKPRSNSLTQECIRRLSNRIELFGVSFLNDIIAASESETDSAHILDDIIAQICLFANSVGADKIALSPDYIDVEYFGRQFNTELVFPDTLMTQHGLLSLSDRMRATLSADDVVNVTSGNVERLLMRS